MKKKTFVIVLCVALVTALAAGGAIAWLTATTPAVVNTFTVGKIAITLAETTGASYKMLPGSELAKDPIVTVTADSEDCWLFVKIAEADNTFAEAATKKFVNYAVATGWTQGDGTTIPADVYYREVAAAAADQPFQVLAGSVTNTDGCITISADLDGRFSLSTGAPTLPSLTFTAYAVQKANVATAAAAWAIVAP